MNQITLRITDVNSFGCIRTFVFVRDGQPVEEAEAIRHGFIVEPADSRPALGALKREVKSVEAFEAKEAQAPTSGKPLWRR